MTPFVPSRVAKAYSLMEAIAAVTILLVGLLAAARIFPTLLQSSTRSIDVTAAVFLAEQKASEIMRDDDSSHTLARTIAFRETPTVAVEWSGDPRLSYSFSGRSLLYPETDVPRGTPNIARVIVRYASSYKQSEDVLYELRFYQP